MWNKIQISGLVTLFVNILCLPLWTECDYGGFVRTLFNKEARIDLAYSGEITRAKPFQYKAIPKPFYATYAYEKGEAIHRANLSLRMREKWQRLSLQLKAQRDGKITMLFRGPDVQDEYGASYSVLTDWRNVKLNGKTILPKRKAFSFKKNFARQLSVKRGDVLHIEAEFRRHHFSIHDFTWLKSGKVWYIITGNLLLFFLICLLLTYIARRRESVRLSDMLLLVVFFLLLFIPMSGISDAMSSMREIRKLAVKPTSKEIFEEKSDYGRKYESWFSDHFGGRVALTKLHALIRNKLSHIIRTQKDVYFKENGWEFRWPPMVPASKLELEPAFLQSCIQGLVQLNEFCQQNQIRLYVLEVPHKELIYREIIKEKFGYDENEVTKISQALDVIREEVRKHHIPYIYPHNALLEASKQDFVFFKWSHHWTDWGAFIGYRELMKEIRKDFPDIPIVSLNDYRKSQSYLMRDELLEDFCAPDSPLLRFLNYSDDSQTLYNYYDHTRGDKMMFKFGKRAKDFSYSEGKHRIMLLGRSQNENFSHFLPYSAAQTKYIRLNGGRVKQNDWFKIIKLYKKDILSFAPDILIFSINTDDLPSLRDLFAKK